MAEVVVDSTTYTNKEFLRRLTESGVNIFSFSFNALESDGATDHMGAQNDIHRIIRIPQGVRILQGYLAQAGIDEHASAAAGVWDLQITDGTTTKTLVDAVTAANSGAETRKWSSTLNTENAVNWQVPAPATGAEYVLQVKCITAAATEASDAGGSMNGLVFYTYNDR